MSVTEIVNRMFIFFAFSLYNMPFFHRYNFGSIRDSHLKFSDRLCLWYCSNMTLTIYISYRCENATMG